MLIFTPVYSEVDTPCIVIEKLFWKFFENFHRPGILPKKELYGGFKSWVLQTFPESFSPEHLPVAASAALDDSPMEVNLAC